MGEAGRQKTGATGASAGQGAGLRNVVAIIALFVLTLAVLAAVSLLAAKSPASCAVIHDCDGNTQSIPLDQDSTTKVTTRLGTNVVVVKVGVVCVSAADCPNHDCVQQGRISAANQQIICLPHEFYIEIIGNNSAEADVESR